MDDLISRQDAIDALEKQLNYLQMLNKNENPTAEDKWYGVNWARNTITDLPPAQKKGEWITGGKDVTGQYFYDKFICNQCFVVVTDKSNFCPKCGADMRKGSTDCMDEDAKQASIPYTYNAPQYDWKCGYPNIN